MQQFHKFITWRLCVAQHVLQRVDLPSASRAANQSLIWVSDQHFASFPRLSYTWYVRGSVDISAEVLDSCSGNHALQRTLTDMTVYVIRDNTMHWVGDENGAGNSINTLNDGSPTCGPPGCIKRPAAIFVNCIHNIKITQYCRRSGIALIVISRVRPVNRTTISGVALCHKEFEGPCSKSRLMSLLNPTVSDITFLYHCVNLFSSHFDCQDYIALNVRKSICMVRSGRDLIWELSCNLHWGKHCKYYCSPFIGGKLNSEPLIYDVKMPSTEQLCLVQNVCVAIYINHRSRTLNGSVGKCHLFIHPG
jgi:hypothetical protein